MILSHDRDKKKAVIAGSREEGERGCREGNRTYNSLFVFTITARETLFLFDVFIL